MPKRLTIGEVQARLSERGGYLVSTSFLGANVRHVFKCAVGHTWETKYAVIQAGSWCPQCARVGSSYGERVARLIMEAMFGAPFLKTRPPWLSLRKGSYLELDGYAPKKAIAFEYHGAQHYEATRQYDTESVIAQQERDAAKARLCRERGVRIVIIPEFTNTRDLPGCIAQVEFSVLWAGLNAPRKWKRPTCLRTLDHPLERVLGASGLADLRRLAADKGGALVSVVSLNSNSNLEWRCQHNHRFEARAEHIRRGLWCPHCSGNARKTLADCHALAETFNGRYLEAEYSGPHVKARWACARGHAVLRTRHQINQKGLCCEFCTQEDGIAELRVLAASRGGSLISTDYLGVHTKHEWRCSCGFQWWSVPRAVKRGTWCPPCGRTEQWRKRRVAASVSALFCEPIAAE